MSIASAQPKDRFDSTVGQYLQAQEQLLYDQAVCDLFGFNAVQIGSLQMDLLSNSRIAHRYKVAAPSNACLTKPVLPPDLACCDDFLPFAAMSVDLLLLPHRLEFSERPHQTLREAARVMMPEGHLIISGFNPMSTWGVCAALKKLFYKPLDYPWYGDFIALNRLKDWLVLLGFEVVVVQSCCHVPPIENLAWHKRFAFMDKLARHGFSGGGGVYFVVAKKRVVGMMPIKPNWKQSAKANLLSVSPKTNTRQSKSREK